MSIASELTNLEGNIEDSYDAVNDMGGVIPAQRNMDNLDQAIRTIPQSTGPTPGDGTLTIQKNGTTVATFTANQSTNTTANISVQENSTMFYGKADTLPGEAGLVIYNNATRTTQTTWQQFADALQAGPVSITFDGDVLDHPYPTAVIHSEVYGGSISFIVESAGASYTYTWDDTDTEPGTPTTKRYQPLLTAGSNISISGDTISATVPTVNDATLTVQHNGTTVDTFTANASADKTINIETIWADTIAPTTAVASISTSSIQDGAITTAKIADGAVTNAKVASDAITTAKIADGQIIPAKLKGFFTANTTDEWVPVSTGTGELQHRIIAPFNADGTIPTSAIANNAVTNAKIDWSTTSRPVYYKGTDWATSWTFKYHVGRPQLIFVAWQSSTAMFVRIYDSIYKVYQTGTSTVTSSVNTTAKTWTISTSNTGVIQVLEINNTQTT